MHRFIFSLSIILLVIHGGTSLSSGLPVKDLRRLTFKVNPREMIEFAFNVNSSTAHTIFYKAYTKHGENEHIPPLVAELELDAMSSTTGQAQCRKPLPKVINLYDELNLRQKTVLSPPGISVNRCGLDSGCCPPGEECISIYNRVKNYTYLHIFGGVLTIKTTEVLEDVDCACRTVQGSGIDFSMLSELSSVGEDIDLCDKDHEYNYTTEMCQCTTPVTCTPGRVPDESLCHCEEAPTPTSISDLGLLPVCPLGEIFNATTQRCECEVACPENKHRDTNSCACQDSQEGNNVTQMCQFAHCPIPFHVDVPTCKCACPKDEGDRNCEKIKMGRKEVREGQCKHIRDQRFLTPPCMEGKTFNPALNVCKCVS